MTQILQAKNMTLSELEKLFQVQFVESEEFFREWQENLPEITDWQKQLLDRVKAGYFNLIKKSPLLEKPINLTIVSPLLFIGEFYLSPFDLKTEKSVEILVENENTVIKGSLDTLVLQEQFWVMVIESKRAELSLEAGLAQILTYMIANPHPEKPCYGLISTGGSFTFIKLVKNGNWKYANSKVFELRNPGNDLHQVLRILKHLSQIALN